MAQSMRCSSKLHNTGDVEPKPMESAAKSMGWRFLCFT